MTTDRGALAALLATMTVFGTVLGTAATSAAAQTEPAAPVRGLERLQTPGTQPTPDATSIPVPAAPTIVLPSAAPTPSPTTVPAPRNAPSPRATTTTAADRTARNRPATNPAATDRTTGERAANRSTSETATQTRTSEPDQTRTSTPAAAPVAAPTQEPVPAPPSSPSATAPSEAAPQPAAPTPTPEFTLSAPETGRSMPLWLSLTAIVVVLGALWALRRKPRGSRFDQIEPEAYVEPTPEPTPEPAAPAPSAPAEPAISSTPASPVVTPVAVAGAAIPASAPKFLEPRAKLAPTPPAAARARLTCELRPLRAGLNMLSATVECEIIITNTGTASAEAIRTGVALLTAHADQDMDLAQFNAAPVVRPAAPPFTLAAGETRTIRTVAAIAREAIRTMTAANRPMFVPVLATNILYATAGDDAQTARAWVVGIERTDSAKLAPFWLDGPAKMFTTVAARPHAATFER